MLGGIINKGQYPRYGTKQGCYDSRVLSVLFSLNKMVSKQSNGFKVPSLAVCSKNRSDLTKNRRNALELIDRWSKKCKTTFNGIYNKQGAVKVEFTFDSKRRMKAIILDN
ncbi:unnamed protein product [Rhizophagus irregularis]|nr:unnamed protein product [Rhizophagus irregularis]